MKEDNLDAVYEDLVKILKKHEKQFELIADSENGYSLNGPYSKKYKKNIWFGGVRITKNYVSYHLMPVYMYPDLVKDISPKLKKQMQGKSCFNFKTQDKELFKELALLTEKSVKTFQREEYL